MRSQIRCKGASRSLFGIALKSQQTVFNKLHYVQIFSSHTVNHNRGEKMRSLIKAYRPITGEPYKNNDRYCEISPCAALAPYIRCFWGTKKASAQRESRNIVIPDTCMDIIFRINYTKNNLSGIFCALDESTCISQTKESADITAVFGIRFYAWTAILFSDESFGKDKTGYFPVEEFSRQLRSELEPLLFDIPDLNGKISAAEKLLLKKLSPQRINTDLMNGIDYILRTNGSKKISDVCGYTAVSQKQLERIFISNTGISPKTMSSLIRYQLLWQDAAFSESFCVLDAVYKYGYTDQPHLLNDFKRRHSMTLTSAVELARNNK